MPPLFGLRIRNYRTLAAKDVHAAMENGSTNLADSGRVDTDGKLHLEWSL